MPILPLPLRALSVVSPRMRAGVLVLDVSRFRGAEGSGEEGPSPTGPVFGAKPLPSLHRDMASVLKQDRERLRAMQKQQPRFSEDQRRELGAVHSWVRKGQLPRALDVMVRREGENEF